MTAQEREGNEMTRGAQVEGAAAGTQDIAAAWAGMTESMARAMRSSMELNARAMTRMHEAWSEATDDMVARMGAMDRTDPDVQEAWNVWRNYSARVARRMDVLARARMEGLGRASASWAASSAGLGARIADAEASGSATALDGAYRAWADLSGGFIMGLGEAIEASGRELAELTTIWSEFTKDMGAAMERLGGRNDEAAKELNRAWATLARTMGERVSSDSARLARDMMDLHQAWARQSEEVGRRLSATGRGPDAGPETSAQDKRGMPSCQERGAMAPRGRAEGDEHGCAEEASRMRARVEEPERGPEVSPAAHDEGGRRRSGDEDESRTTER